MTDQYGYVEDAQAASPLAPELGPGENVVVGPLSDTEAERGGLVKIAAFMRTKQSNDALRKKAERKKLAEKGQCVLTLTARDEDREVLRSAAGSMIEDDNVSPAVAEILANAELRSLLADMANSAELHEAVMLVWRNPKYATIARSLLARPELLNSLRLILEQPNVIGIGQHVLATSGLRRWLIRRLTGRRA